MIIEIVFWLAVFALFYSYLFYPWILKLLAAGRKENDLNYQQTDELPFVSVILSVHNEEMVITEKIRSIYYTLYPLNKFEVLVGSDNSSDGTNYICKVCTENYEHFQFFPFNKRVGKPAIVNQLVEKAKGEILILTDAANFFEINTIPELVRHFKNQDIDIVGGNIINEKTYSKGIALLENSFIRLEIIRKYREGLIWGKTMGIYGAIYAIRKAAYARVPDHFSVDDFFITMNVLMKKRKAILNLAAVSQQKIPDKLSTEFKRRIRISAGNFQNLWYFRSCLRSPFSALSFIFLSHKVIRWVGPFMLILIFSLNLILAFRSEFYLVLFLIQIFMSILPFIDMILRKFNLHSIILRFVAYFYAMNFALLLGFFKSISGMKTNIWQPTRR